MDTRQAATDGDPPKPKFPRGNSSRQGVARFGTSSACPGWRPAEVEVSTWKLQSPRSSLGSARAQRPRGGDQPQPKFPRGNSSRQGRRSVRHELSGLGVATCRSCEFPRGNAGRRGRRSRHGNHERSGDLAQLKPSNAESSGTDCRSNEQEVSGNKWWRPAAAESFHVETPAAMVIVGIGTRSTVNAAGSHSR